MKKSDFWFAVFLVTVVLGGALTVILNETHSEKTAGMAKIKPYLAVPIDVEDNTISFACIDGKAFAVTAGRHGVVSAVQVFRAGMAGVPEECPKERK